MHLIFLIIQLKQLLSLRYSVNFGTKLEQNLEQNWNKIWNKIGTKFGTKLEQNLEQNWNKIWNNGTIQQGGDTPLYRVQLSSSTGQNKVNG